MLGQQNKSIFLTTREGNTLSFLLPKKQGLRMGGDLIV